MSNYHYGAQHYSAMPNQNSHNNSHGHHGRSRRGPRVSSQTAHRQYKAHRSPKTVPEAPVYSEYRQRLEAARGFSLEDDEQFCPFNLLTEDDLQNIYTNSFSDRGSLSSNSPESSPLQQQVQPTPAFLLSTTTNTNNFTPSNPNVSYQSHNANMKLHQPLAQRTRNAIPIVDPSTRSVASPPLSVSPGRQMQQQYMQQRRW